MVHKSLAQIQDNFLTSKSLLEAIETVSPVREPLIEGILYKKSANLIYAPDGVGKSVVGLQLCLQSTVDGAKVFGEFNVPKGLKVLYIQMERSVDESLERMREMIKGTPFNPDNFVIDTSLQGRDLTDKHDLIEALEHIERVIDETIEAPDLIHIDPIYALVSGDMLSNKDVAPITNFSRILQNYYGCSIQFIHHSNRGQRNLNTGERMNEDMFGSRFMSAHFTGVFHLSEVDGGVGTVLKAQKSSQRNLEKEIELIYDPQTMLSWVKDIGSRDSRLSKLTGYIRACKENKNVFSFDDLVTKSGLCTSSVRKYLHTHPLDEAKVVQKGKYGKNLYQFCG